MYAPLGLEAAEDPATPARAGDAAGNGRQRFVGPPLVLEVVILHRDAALDALPFAAGVTNVIPNIVRSCFINVDSVWHSHPRPRGAINPKQHLSAGTFTPGESK